MKNRHSALTYFFFLLYMASMGYASLDLNTTTMFAVSAMMFLTCAFSGIHLFGGRATAILVVLSLAIGWFAEYTGEKYGWFFGHYVYTDALGLKVFGVPLVIPLMWFNLCYVAMVMSFLIVERRPFRSFQSVPEAAGIAFLGAVLVTAYDLAADPYMVYVVKAWVMEKKDGWWFGETLQGFVGWMVVAFSILFIFLLAAKKKDWSLPQDFGTLHALIPVSMYFSYMCFWVLYGHPVETRTISAFAMGLPILVILLSLKHWKNFKH